MEQFFLQVKSFTQGTKVNSFEFFCKMLTNISLDWTAGMTLPAPRYGHCMVVINNGSIFISGGIGDIGGLLGATRTCWMFHPTSNHYSSCGTMSNPRSKHSCEFFKGNVLWLVQRRIHQKSTTLNLTFGLLALSFLTIAMKTQGAWQCFMTTFTSESTIVEMAKVSSDFTCLPVQRYLTNGDRLHTSEPTQEMIFSH